MDKNRPGVGLTRRSIDSLLPSLFPLKVSGLISSAWQRAPVERTKEQLGWITLPTEVGYKVGESTVPGVILKSRLNARTNHLSYACGRWNNDTNFGKNHALYPSNG